MITRLDIVDHMRKGAFYLVFAKPRCSGDFERPEKGSVFVSPEARTYWTYSGVVNVSEEAKERGIKGFMFKPHDQKRRDEGLDTFLMPKPQVV